MDEFGTLTVRTLPGGSFEITQADDVIGISSHLLHGHIPGLFNEAGEFAPTPEYRYRPVRFAYDGTIVVCERVR
jgi:hypothetical protein